MREKWPRTETLVVPLMTILKESSNRTVVLAASGLAGVAASRRQGERAARLFGAAEALSERMGVEVSWSAWRTLNERGLSAVRERIDAATLGEAWAEGRAMTLEEVVAEALAVSG
jgi:hypothetical protein